MKKKKLALVNVFFPPQTIGGATRIVSDQFNILLENYAREFDLVVFTTENTMTTVPYQIVVYAYQGVLIYKATCLFREHMDWHCQDLEMADLFAQFLAYEQPDLVHFHCIQRLTGSIIDATIKYKTPYWITIHDAWWISDYQFLMDDDDVVYPDGHPDPYVVIPLKNGITREASYKRRFYLKRLLHQAEGVLTVSESFADIYRKNHIGQIKVNQNGISNQIIWQSKNTRYTKKIVCGHIGGMSTHKGYFLLKEAIELVNPGNIELLIVDLAQPESYHKKAFWGNVSVTFVGRVIKDDIVSLYQKIDILFVPSLWPESYGLVSREAMACRCWVVASDMGGIGDDVTPDNGIKIKANLNALIEAIEAIDNNVKKYKQLSKSVNIRKIDEQVNELVSFFK